MKKDLRTRSFTGAVILFVASLLIYASGTLFLSHPADEPPSATTDTIQSSGPSNPDSLYQVLLTTINELYTKKAYRECLDALKQAQALKPGVPSIQERIIRVEGLLAQQEKDLKEYQRLTDLADGYFREEKYLDAKSTYQMAIDVYPDQPYARERLNATMGLLRAQKASNILYDVAVANADKLFAAKDYTKAKQEYENASAILPGERYPKERINAILKIQLDEKVREELYATAIAEGDRLFEVENYRRSLQEFRIALEQKPEERYPQERIDELTRIIRELEAREEAYRQAIASADQLFTGERYPDAREGYEGALKIKENEPYPLNRIREIDAILAEIDRIETSYAYHLTLADSLYISKAFIQSRQHYQMALRIKPGQAYPRAMLEKTSAGVETMVAGEIAAEEARKLDSLAAIDSIRQELARQAAVDENYRLAIVQADRQFQEKQYDSARVTYLAAGELRPEKPYWQERVEEIDRILLMLADKSAQDERYTALIAEGDRLQDEKEYAGAIKQFTDAAALKPDEKYPPQKIAELQAIVAELERQDEVERDYNRAVAEGDSLLALKSYALARSQYQTALTLKPQEAYPKTKQVEIDSIQQEIARQAAAQDERYAELIAEGDRLQSEKEYAGAIRQFTDAAALKPEQRYPPQKIAELQAIVAELERLAALERSYTNAIAEGDSLLALKSYALARSLYQTAISLKPQEEYPKTKQTEIDSILADIRQSEQLTQQYQAAVEEGDRLFSAQSWDQAIASFTQALTIKPEESYPNSRIAAIDSIQQEIARQAAIDENYRLTIVQADRQFQAKQYDSARVTYLAAGELRPKKPYWQEKVGEIDRIFAAIRKRDAEYLAGIRSADSLFALKRWESARAAYESASAIKEQETYPKEQIREINRIVAELEGKRNTFDRLVTNADSYLFVKEFAKAKDTYQQALDLFPEESYPKEQLRRITGIVDSIYRANKSDYDKAVGEGDRFFNSYEYDKAIDAYTQALAFLSMEAYPREMILKIRSTIAENAIADVLNEPVVIRSGDEQRFEFTPVNMASRRNNFIYLKVKNLSDEPFTILMRYGKDGQTNGGLALRNITTDGEVNERLISVKTQDPWYREDNNWISLYPQGGDIEVSFIQVSRAIQ